VRFDDGAAERRDGPSGRPAEARDAANSAHAILSERTAPVSRAAGQTSAARWAQAGLEVRAALR
jgi:hypothetical protein